MRDFAALDGPAPVDAKAADAVGRERVGHCLRALVAGGVAVITVDYPYGPGLDIVGQDPAVTYRLFTEPLEVTAQPLAADLTVATDIGLADAFPLNLPGYLGSDVAGATMYARLPDGTELRAAGLREFARVTPEYLLNEDGTLTATDTGTVLTPDHETGFYTDEAVYRRDLERISRRAAGRRIRQHITEQFQPGERRPAKSRHHGRPGAVQQGRRVGLWCGAADLQRACRRGAAPGRVLRRRRAA